MAKGIHRLTALAVKNAKPGAMLNDGGGLTLRVTANGGGRWSLRYKMRGQKQREMGLGPFPATSLASARRAAAAARAAIADGLDPIAEAERIAKESRLREQVEANSVSFGHYADHVFLPGKVQEFSSAKQAAQWERTFTEQASALREKPLGDVTREDVLAVLRPIWDTTHDTARRVRGRLEALFSYAIQNGAYQGDNPAAWRQFNHTLSPQRKLTHGHRRALPYDEAAGFIAALRTRQESAVTALMAEFIALAACRMGEARLAVWREMDMDRAVWLIPAARMKMRRGHNMPLTARMIEILEIMRAQHRAMRGRDPSPADLIFPNEKGTGPLSENAAMMLLTRMNYRDRMTVHGLRATFRTWAGECTEYPRELIEEQLAHQLDAVEQAYVRGSTVERRRALMEDWNTYLNGATPAGGQASDGNTVRLHAAAGGKA
ncbi:tyrosine-type recombinase/integrase [Pararhodobacter oceanensis]|uniref:Integrase n=1 Tax=Pararhodobacter oceanensis TaxID=2172121 RepID=A0A2T8HY43_9RHOB|nr:site-specific integrase [Pararhodobacter oceanensis]PVH30329.1 integrase [Pararhodobacter oceanensis]